MYVSEKLELFNDEEQEQSNEMFEHHHIVVDKGQTPLRIDKFLSIKLSNVSRNKIQISAGAGCIIVNGKPVKSNYKVKGDDDISIVLPYPIRETEIIPEEIPLNIVYEDNDVIVIDKQANLVVHPGHGNYTGTLLNGLLYHFEKNNEKNVYPYLVHRIDKDTTGLIVLAKNEPAQSFLAKQFFDHSIDRKYLALVWGNIENESGTITGYIGRSKSDRKIRQVYTNGDYGKHAVTHYKIVERFMYVTLVECQLETGRTHQIRAHFKHIRHPLFNDATYGGDRILKGTTFSKYKLFIKNCFKIIERQTLHAYKLGFVHPATKKIMSLTSELPQDMKKVIEKWRNYSEIKK